MSILVDQAARTTALTSIERSLLVEAGAGSGKTSLMAGRVTMMLAAGVAPRNIAAVSFTEMASSELLGRITRFVYRVIDGDIPPDLAAAFPDGVSEVQRANLRAARKDLGELTATTIHGFCQRLLQPYPVEANIDPGARILDPANADLVFGDVYEAWLRDRLSGKDPYESLITTLVTTDAWKATELIRTIAYRLRTYRDAVTPGHTGDDGAAERFATAVEAFASFCRGLPSLPEGTAAILEEFEKLRAMLADWEGWPRHRRAVAIATLELSSVLVTKGGTFCAYRAKSKWEKLYSKIDAGRLNDVACGHYNACSEAFEAFRADLVGWAIGALVDEVRPVIDRYQQYKREAAALDFEDLLLATREMLRGHPAVCAALADRYRHILIDEYQDTDPVQTEIVRRIAFDPPGGDRTAPLETWVPRPGAVFLVGDPKQAIYRFRGADVHSYLATRESLRAVDAEAILEVRTNFRSCAGILAYVNEVFREPLSRDRQPGFAPLSHHRPDHGQGPSVAVLPIEAGENADDARETEAKAVAEVCARLIGDYLVVGRDQTLRRCQPGDIALLAPVGTDLWRYEAALEAMGISVATQAGKGMYRRQEVQDLIAITRVLADPRDTLALGALLRGPLVGLTDEELLDITAGLPRREDGRASVLRLSTKLEDIAHPLARDVIDRLQRLRRAARRATPHNVLAQAIEELRVRPILLARHGLKAERALANVDRYLEMARSYPVRGLREFSDAMRRAWEEKEAEVEARPDAEEQSVSIITMHSAKGLEWPIVVPINMATQAKGQSKSFLDVGTRTMWMDFLGIKPTGHGDAYAAHKAETDAERVRLLYVATTRARDLLIVPRFEAATNAWGSKIVKLDLDDLPVFDLSRFDPSVPAAGGDRENIQDAREFAAEQRRIVEGRHSVVWRSPSRHEPTLASSARLSLEEIVELEPETDVNLMIVGSRERGIILHKLMEEVLTGETDDDEAALLARAHDLRAQLIRSDAATAYRDADPAEMAATVRRTLTLPQIAAMRSRMVPEVSVGLSDRGEKFERVTAGVVDTVILRDGSTAEIEAVVDWKGDVHPDASTMRAYREQVCDYLRALGLGKGYIVYMTMGKIDEVVALAA